MKQKFNKIGTMITKLLLHEHKISKEKEIWTSDSSIESEHNHFQNKKKKKQKKKQKKKNLKHVYV